MRVCARGGGEFDGSSLTGFLFVNFVQVHVFQHDVMEIFADLVGR